MFVNQLFYQTVDVDRKLDGPAVIVELHCQIVLDDKALFFEKFLLECLSYQTIGIT